MKYRDDYAAAGIPMLPVVRGHRGGDPPDRRVRDRHRRGDVRAALTGDVGRFYAVAALVLGVAVRGRRAGAASATPTPQAAIKFFALVERRTSCWCSSPLPSTPSSVLAEPAAAGSLLGRRAGRDRGRWCDRVVAALAVDVIAVIVTASTTTRRRRASPHHRRCADRRSRARPRSARPRPDFALPRRRARRCASSTFARPAVVLTFFASWCHPCRGGVAGAQQGRSGDHDDDLHVVGVTYQDLPSRRAGVREAAQA